MEQDVSEAGFGTPRPPGFCEMRRQRATGTSGVACTLLAASLLISGCTTTRYVPVKCLTPEQLEELRKAEPPKVHDKLTGKADEDVKIVAGSAIRLRAYSRGLLDVLGVCVGE